MGLGAAIGGIAGIASAVIGSNAATSAATAQQNADIQGEQTQLQMYNQTRSDLLPYNVTGQTALNQLAALYGATPTPGVNGNPPTAGQGGNFNATGAINQLQNYPGFQFALQTGGQAVSQNINAASPGGNALTALTQYGQGLATNNVWTPYVNQLNALAGLGESAASQTGNFATATGQGVASSLAQGGTAAASGLVGSSNAITGAIGGGINNQLLLAALNGSSFGS